MKDKIIDLLCYIIIAFFLIVLVFGTIMLFSSHPFIITITGIICLFILIADIPMGPPTAFTIYSGILLLCFFI